MSLVGTTLLSLVPQLLAVVRVTPGTSTLSTELTTRNCSIAPSTGSSNIALQGLRQRHRAVGLVAAGLLQDIDEVQFVADAEPREVDDDVVALGDALLVEPWSTGWG